VSKAQKFSALRAELLFFLWYAHPGANRAGAPGVRGESRGSCVMGLGVDAPFDTVLFRFLLCVLDTVIMALKSKFNSECMSVHDTFKIMTNIVNI
jgi:hypothetical protein